MPRRNPNRKPVLAEAPNDAAAEKAGWQPHVGARKQVAADVFVGQGIGYATRSGTRVAVVAEVFLY